MSDPMSLRQYAKHRGCHPHSVEVALQNGRIPSAHKEGHRWFIDPVAADREWLENTDENQKRTLTRRELGRDQPEQRPATVAAPVPSARSVRVMEFDRDEALAALDSGEFLQMVLPDFVDQVLVPVRKVARAITAVPGEYRLAAIGEVLALLGGELCGVVEQEQGRRQG
jgi:hypothetical protein